jgi:antitoxin ChpS
MIMHMEKLRSVGGSVMFAIPKAILESLELLPDRKVGLSVSQGCLIVDPHPRSRYTLAELVGQCDASAPPTAQDQAWLEAEPIGREAL